MVTGGSRGLGAVYARILADRGYSLVLVARDRDSLHDTADRIRRVSAVHVEALPADLTDRNDRSRVEERLTDATRPVHLLVNNAGVECHDRFDEAPVADLEYEIGLNVVATMRLSHAVLPLMIAAGQGTVVNIASFAGYLAAGGNAYSATKAWVLAFTDTVAASLTGTGVQMTAVCAGRIRDGEHDGSAYSPLWVAPEKVVIRSLADAARGRTLSSPGFLYRTLTGFLESPRTALRRFARLAGRDRARRLHPRATPDKAYVPDHIATGTATEPGAS